MFFIFFFHFFRRKSFFFFFSCISFKYILLLALVSEFNCFLRSQMWCLNDIGRDSWDWVGPPAWVRACFNSPEWGGGSSPVKTEPPQIVLLLLLFFVSASCVCISTSHARAAESKANYYSLHAKPGDVGQCNPNLTYTHPETQMRPTTTMRTLMHHMRITN